MRILIDECTPRQIKGCLRQHYVRTARQAGFSGYQNGWLLKAAEADFDLLITSDKNLRYQQNLSGRKIAILLLFTNNRTVIERNAETILEAVNLIQPAEFREVFL